MRDAVNGALDTVHSYVPVLIIPTPLKSTLVGPLPFTTFIGAAFAGRFSNQQRYMEIQGMPNHDSRLHAFAHACHAGSRSVGACAHELQLQKKA